MALSSASDSQQRTTASTIQTSDASSSKLKFGQDFESFLKLLVAQLQNQDPLSPLESHEFTNQLVLFAGVEQQIRSNELSEELVKSEKQRKLTNGLGFIGKKIQYGDDHHEFDSVGEIKFRFNVPEDVSNVKLQVFDEEKKLVTQLDTGEIKAGDTVYSWKGDVYSANGQKTKNVDRGKFSFEIVSGVTSRGTEISSAKFTVLDNEGIVAGIVLKNSEILVKLQNGKEIALDKVNEINQNSETEEAPKDTAEELRKASTLVGKTISYRSATVPFSNGSGKFTYSLPGNADSGSVYITDLDGRLVYTDTLSLNPTENGEGTQTGTYDWDGTSYKYDSDGKLERTKDADGNEKPDLGTAKDGEYIFYLNNVKAGEKEIAKSQYLYDLPVREGKVTSVEVVNGKNILYKVGEVPVLPESVIRVKESS